MLFRLEVLRVDVDAGGLGVVGPAELLHVVVVAGLLGGHEAGHQLGKLLLVHVHAEGVGEGRFVDAHSLGHVGGQAAHIALHRRRDLLLDCGCHLRHRGLHHLRHVALDSA